MSQPKQNWLSVHRSRYAIFFYKALAAMVAPVYATPLTTITQAGTSTTTSPSATPTAPSSEPHRDGSFQVLADGTQDLAALVGIFATNSVECYAFDYNQGHLSSAVSMLSLLGILGFVRALVKLGMGPYACMNAGFDMKLVRPFYGVFLEHLSDEIYEVRYTERLVQDHQILWQPRRIIRHTQDSFAWQFESGKLKELSEFTVMSFSLERYHRKFTYWFEDLHLWGNILGSSQGDAFILLFTAVCAGLTSGLVIPLRESSPPTWNLYFATVGLFIPIYFTSLAWAWVYAQEQLPHVGLDWSGSSFKSNHFAFMCKGKGYIVLAIRPIMGKVRDRLEFLSLIAAFLAIIGYVCQYIEVRRMSSRNSAIWLAAQGVLGLGRLAMWIAKPTMADRSSVRNKWESSIPSLSEKQLGLIHVSKNLNGDFSMPVWAAEFLQEIDSCVHDPFTFALYAYAGRDISGTDLLALLKAAKKSWDMPKDLFMSWFNTHTGTDQVVSTLRTSVLIGFTARLIVDGEGNRHILPFWVMEDYNYVNNEIKIFGNLTGESATVVLISKHRPRDSAVTDQMITEWQTLLEVDPCTSALEEQSNTGLEKRYWGISKSHITIPISKIRLVAMNTMDTMWEDLKSIFRRTAEMRKQQLPDIFRDEAGSSRPENAPGQGEARSRVPETSSLVHRRISS